MANNEADDELLIRFLAGDVTPEERDHVERRFMDDPTFFENLRALEEEILLARARGELSEARRRQIDAGLARSPARQRQYREVEAFAAAVSAVRVAWSKGGTRTWRVWRAGTRSIVALGAAAAIVLGVLGTWGWRRDHGEAQLAPSTSRQPGEATTVTFFLKPGNARTATEPQANVFRIDRGVGTVVLELTFADDTHTSLRATLAPIGGGLIETDTQVARRANGTVAVHVPAQRLPPGDYLLTLSAEGNGGARDTIATRFFSLAP